MFTRKSGRRSPEEGGLRRRRSPEKELEGEDTVAVSWGENRNGGEKCRGNIEWVEERNPFSF
ncbi:hypothetical protein SESBI_37626 [Sesbania bispinosa]|nr:hypothetical protein SESBI_37626 [Sesbania bispinosa]